MRQFKSEDYCKDNIVVIRGSDNILEDVKKKYHEEFDEALVKYNEGKRSDRKIQDYLKYVSESGKNDVAAEIIIQLGDEEFWHDKSMDLQRKMVPILEEQVRHLEELEEIETKVQVNEEKLEEFDVKAEETINKLVETEAQKGFMRYAFLKEPKTMLGKIVSEAWKKFRDWWDRHKRPEIEGNVRKSVLGQLANYKKQVAEESRIRPVPVKNKGMNRD
ncbi:hypothetical protein [Oribacterium sp. WCC10]|uniref:hypothetical protein n=1 Tax=Oribacterium sp. WCC10 TaxID=1855343 RepID=UPI001113DDA7|nr:hypothetical protein [Oribacterium sp. WCC10]